jgi:hypothetical protein
MNRLWSRLLSRLVSPGLAALAMLVLLAPAAANATPYVVKLKQQGTDVVAIGSGEFDLTGLNSLGLDDTVVGISPNVGFLGAVAPRAGIYTVMTYTGLTGPATNFGSGGIAFASSAHGIFAGIYISSDFYGVPVIYLPIDYNSGTPLAGSLTWNNASFASLGVTPGAYVWTWGTGAEQSYTLRIAVPEPATLAMFGFGLLLVGTFVGLRRRVA